MRIEDLRSFRVIVEQGNLRRAARLLGVTQSSLSKMLVRLEHDVQAPVLERTSTGVSLTDAGAIVLQHADKVHTALHDMDTALRDHRGARSGSVRIGCLPMLMSLLISPVLARFFVNRPLATFSIEAQLSVRLLDQLARGQIDLAVAAIPERIPAGLSVTALGKLRMQIVARADHPRLHRLRSMAELGAERWAVPATMHYLRDWLDARFTDAGLPAPRLAVESTASPVAFAALLKASDLLGIMPVQVLDHSTGAGLVAVGGDDSHWEHAFGLFQRCEGYLSPLCQDFATAIATHCQTNHFQ